MLRNESQASHNPARIILQKFLAPMTEWPLRKSIPGSMLEKQQESREQQQKQQESREQQQKCAIAPKIISQEFFREIGCDCDNFARPLRK